MFVDLAKALAAGLSLWEHKEKNKYRDRLMSLERDYYEESNKPPESINHARLDHLEFELRILTRGWAASIAESDAAPKP